MKNFLREVFWKLVLAVIDRPLTSPTDRQKELVEELRTAFRNLPALPSTSDSPSEQQWFDNMNVLREKILNDDPREFLRWDFMVPMVVGNAAYLRPEIAYLKNLPDWKSRWYKVTIESPIGHPTPYWTHRRSSGNLIHHAYHLAQFEEKTGTNVDKFRFIFEFGGGYGSMCRLCFNMNFKGKYVIYDLPGFQALQQFFLKSIGVELHSVESFKNAESGVVCVSDLEQLRVLLENYVDPSATMFIATWSISEVPLSLRDYILSFTSQFKAFLIGYQHQFREINNFEFFNTWKNAQYGISWHNLEIVHLPGNYYLLGNAKSL